MSGTINIIESRPGEDTFRYFDEVLTNVYPPGSLRFKTKESFNAFYFQSCLIALVGGDVAGRLCVYSNPHINIDGKPCLLIGNFECVDDDRVCSALIQYVERIADDKNISYVVGPVNGTTWDDYRFPLTECVDPYLSDSLQQPYYAEMFERNGFNILHRYYTSVAENDGNKKAQPQEIEYLKANAIAIRNIDLSNYESELRKVYVLCIEAFKNNALYSPVGESYFIQKYIGLKDLLDPAFVLLAEHEGELAGLYFCLPDLYAHRVIVKTIAKHPDCHVKGLIDIMGKMLYEAAYAKGYSRFIHAYMHEHNRSRTVSENFHGQVTREYAVFVKQLAHER